MSSKTVIAYIGKGGSGKSYLGGKVAHAIGCKHHSVGNDYKKLAEQRNKESAKKIYDEGKIMEMSDYHEIVRAYVGSLAVPNIDTALSLDGLFRSKAQVDVFMSELGDIGHESDINVICVYLDVAEEILLENRRARIKNALEGTEEIKQVDVNRSAIMERVKLDEDLDGIAKYIEEKYSGRIKLLRVGIGSIDTREQTLDNLVKELASITDSV